MRAFVRADWFEIFESVRKVLLVGVPACFPDRGGDSQLIFGLMVCFLSFGAYMLYAPFVDPSDDQLSQLAQVQIFLSMIASIGLRMGSNPTLETIVSVCFFFIPIFALFMETPLADELRGLAKMCERVTSYPRKRVAMYLMKEPTVAPVASEAEREDDNREPAMTWTEPTHEM